MPRWAKRSVFWRRYRNERELSREPRWRAAKLAVRFTLQLALLDLRRWWWRLFAPLDVTGIYMGHRPHKSALILDNLAIQVKSETPKEQACQ